MASARRQSLKAARAKRQAPWIAGIITFAVLGTWCLELYACPMCSDIVGRGKEALAAMRFGNGIAWSILLLLTVPFCIMGTLVWVMIRSERKTVARGSEN